MHKKIPVWLILIFLAAFHLIGNFIWLKRDATYLMHDAHHHFLFSASIFREMQQYFFPSLAAVADRCVSWRWHGIFTGLITAPFFFLFGLTQDAGVMASSLVFFPILLFSTFGIARYVFDKKTGLFAAFIVGMYPLVCNHLRLYMLDLPLTAMVSCSIYMLLKTDYFENKRYAFVFGISTGLGVLTKFNFLVFLAGPLVFYAFGAFRRDQKSGSKKLRNFAITVACALLLSVFFLKFKFWEVLDRVYECSWFNPKFYSPHKTFFPLFSYWVSVVTVFIAWSIRELSSQIMSLPLFLLFLIASLSLLRKKFPFKTILFSWIITPFVLLSFFFHSPAIGRYLMPLLPAMAIVSAAWVGRINFRPFRVALITATVLFCIFQYAALSYGIIFFDPMITLQFRSREDGSSRPLGMRWPAEEVLRDILKTKQEAVPEANVFFIDSVPEIYEPIEYESFRNVLPVVIQLFSLSEEEKYKDASSRLPLIAHADYVVVVDQSDVMKLNIPFNTKEMILNARKYFFDEAMSGFQLLGTYRLPGGNSLLLFKNKSDYIQIGKTPSSFFIKNGLLKWYYHGRNILKDGLISTFVYKGNDFLSSQGIWKTERTGNAVIEGRIEWPGTSLAQEWSIDATSENGFVLQVRSIAAAALEMKEVGFILPFSHFYKHWKAQDKEGGFERKNILGLAFLEMPAGTRSISFSGGRPYYPDLTITAVSPLSGNSCLLSYKKDIRNMKCMLRKAQGDTFILPEGRQDLFTLKVTAAGANGRVRSTGSIK